MVSAPGASPVPGCFTLSGAVQRADPGRGITLEIGTLLGAFGGLYSLECGGRAFARIHQDNIIGWRLFLNTIHIR